MNPRLTATSAADILAFVPHALHFQPRDSFVFIALRGTNVGAVLRVDAPGTTPPEEYAATVTGYLLNDKEADGTLLAVYTETTGTGPDLPFLSHLHDIAQSLHTAGRELHDGWVVTPTGWYSLDAIGAESLRPLSEIRDSTLNAELIFTGSDPTAEETVPDPACTTDTTAAAASIDAHTGQWETGDPLDFNSPAMLEARTAWEHALETTPDPDNAPLLISALQQGPVRDRMFADIISTDEDPDLYPAILTGQYPHGPDWHRTDKSEALLLTLLSTCPHGYRAALYTALGWINWYKGKGSRAHAYYLLALHDRPRYRLATLLDTAVTTGILALPATSPATAYRDDGQAPPV